MGFDFEACPGGAPCNVLAMLSSYFAERFLIAKGCTPTQYRKD